MSTLYKANRLLSKIEFVGKGTLGYYSLSEAFEKGYDECGFRVEDVLLPALKKIAHSKNLSKEDMVELAIKALNEYGGGDE